MVRNIGQCPFWFVVNSVLVVKYVSHLGVKVILVWGPRWLGLLVASFMMMCNTIGEGTLKEILPSFRHAEPQT